MFRPMTPVDFWRGAITLAAMLTEAQMVIAMRLMGMAGGWNVDRGENARMVGEKVRAAAEAGRAASAAVLRGSGPAAAAIAALKPVRRRTRENARRLGKRGPATGPRRG